jgi:hypothetical protein
VKIWDRELDLPLPENQRCKRVALPSQRAFNLRGITDIDIKNREYFPKEIDLSGIIVTGIRAL